MPGAQLEKIADIAYRRRTVSEASSDQARREPRIRPVAALDEEQRALLALAPARPDGSVRNIFLTLLHHPIMLKRFNAFAGTFMRFGLIPSDEREMVILRVAGRTGSRYELAQHIAIARAESVDEGTILAILLQTPSATRLDDRQALLMEVTDALLYEGAVSDELWEALSRHYEPAALLELLCLIGFYRMTADILNVVGVEPEEEPELEIDWSRVTMPGRPHTFGPAEAGT